MKTPKSKLRKMSPQKKAAAMKFLAKEDMINPVHVLVSDRQYQKLRGELLITKSSITKWGEPKY